MIIVVDCWLLTHLYRNKAHHQLGQLYPATTPRRSKNKGESDVATQEELEEEEREADKRNCAEERHITKDSISTESDEEEDEDEEDKEEQEKALPACFVSISFLIFSLLILFDLCRNARRGSLMMKAVAVKRALPPFTPTVHTLARTVAS